MILRTAGGRAALRRLAVVALAAGPLAAAPAEEAPPVPREFRAAWIATVANIDWPSEPGLAPAEAKAELAALFDLAVDLRLNAIVMQVRPACDAMYASEIEPWSHYLTGKQGEPPADGFDPLAWACDQAHARGLELHAWFNPYRAVHASMKGPLAANHIAARRPDLAPAYGKQRWLDPGQPEAATHSIDVVLDVVRRYDIDAIHFDDYFYPYPVTEKIEGDADREIPFPDEASWRRYSDNTPEPERLSRDDWRRDNVNRFVRRLSDAIHQEKPHVRFGISPFGIWRPGHPDSIRGFDQYEKLYADARLWLREGWVDYFTPQLYWAIDQRPQSFTTLLAWWADQNVKQRHLWPGLYTSRLGGEEPSYQPEEIVNQIVAAREQLGATGHVHFSIKALARDWGGVNGTLRERVYTDGALPPASPWLAAETPTLAAPTLQYVTGEAPTVRLALDDGAAERWVVQKRVDGAWETRVVGPQVDAIRVRPSSEGAIADRLAVRAVDRFGRLGAATVIETAPTPTGAPSGGAE